MLRHTLKLDLANRHSTQGIYKLFTHPSLCLQILTLLFPPSSPPPPGWPCPCRGSAPPLPSSSAVIAGVYDLQIQATDGPMPKNSIFMSWFVK